MVMPNFGAILSPTSPGVSNQGCDKIAPDFSAGVVLLKSVAIREPGVSNANNDKIAQDLKHNHLIAEVGCHPFAWCFGVWTMSPAPEWCRQNLVISIRLAFRTRVATR